MTHRSCSDTGLDATRRKHPPKQIIHDPVPVPIWYCGVGYVHTPAKSGSHPWALPYESRRQSITLPGIGTSGLAGKAVSLSEAGRRSCSLTRSVDNHQEDLVFLGHGSQEDRKIQKGKLGFGFNNGHSAFIGDALPPRVEIGGGKRIVLAYKHHIWVASAVQPKLALSRLLASQEIQNCEKILL